LELLPRYGNNSTLEDIADKPLSLYATQTQEAKPPCSFVTGTLRKPGFLRFGQKKCAQIMPEI
jgi:hypothetical protein